jgi:hypothetical protein
MKSAMHFIGQAFNWAGMAENGKSKIGRRASGRGFQSNKKGRRAQGTRLTVEK